MESSQLVPWGCTGPLQGYSLALQSSKLLQCFVFCLFFTQVVFLTVLPIGEQPCVPD